MRSLKQFRKIKKSRKNTRKSKKNTRKSRKNTRGGVKKNTDTFFSSIPYPAGVKAPVTNDSIKPDFLIESENEKNLLAPKRKPPREITIMELFPRNTEEKKNVERYSGLDKDEADDGFTETFPQTVTVRDNRVLNQTPYYVNDTGQQLDEKKVGSDFIEELERKDIIGQYNPSSAPKLPYDDAATQGEDYSQFVELGGRRRKPKRSATIKKKNKNKRSASKKRKSSKR